MIRGLMLGLLAVGAVTFAIGMLVWWFGSSQDDDDPFEDDYFSDIQDAVKEGTEVDGQAKLWETGQMPVAKVGGGWWEDEPKPRPTPKLDALVGGGASIPPQHREAYLAHVADNRSYGISRALGVQAPDPLPLPDTQTTAQVVSNWWDSQTTAEQDDFVAAMQGLQAVLSTPLSIEETVPQLEQPEPVSEAPAATEDYMAAFEDDLSLWRTQQEIARKQWLQEMGLDSE